MNRTRLLLLVLTLGFAVVALTQGARVVSRQDEARFALAHQATALEKQLGDQRRETAATLSELALAEQQLIQLQATSDADGARAREIESWLARVRQLKQLFEQHPDQRIPAMRFLTDDDWLQLAKQNQLDTDDNTRKALAAVRDRSKMKALGGVSAAIRKYVQAVGTAPPPTALSLASSLDNPADLDLLQGFEVTPWSGRPRAGGPAWQLQERAPIDGDYDSRSTLTPDGYMSALRAPIAWIPNSQERIQQASASYSAANKGALNSGGITPLLPYFNPPLDGATVEKLLKAEREWKP